MTQISTWLGNTIESARRVRFEPTGDFAATNVQDAIDEAGTSGGGLPALTTPYITPPESTTIPASAVVVQADTSGGTVALVVPSSIAWHALNGGYGTPLTIFDKAGNAATNNVTITFTGGQTASGQASLTISNDYGGWALEPKDGGGWIIV